MTDFVRLLKTDEIFILIDYDKEKRGYNIERENGKTDFLSRDSAESLNCHSPYLLRPMIDSLAHAIRNGNISRNGEFDPVEAPQDPNAIEILLDIFGDGRMSQAQILEFLEPHRPKEIKPETLDGK